MWRFWEGGWISDVDVRDDFREKGEGGWWVFGEDARSRMRI